MRLEKRRYLLLKLERAGGSFTADEAKHCVYEAIFSLLGEAGAARAAVQAKEFDASHQLLIVKCANKELDAVIAALAAKVEFKGVACALRLKKISGAISRLVGPPSPTKRLPRGGE